MRVSRRVGLIGMVVLVIAGCAADKNGPGLADARQHFTPPEKIPQVQAARSMSAEQLMSTYPELPRAELGYTPSQAEHFACLQRSTFKLDPQEQRLFDQQGLVLSHQRARRPFAMFYLEAFHADLPVFISADAILHAWHRAYDELLVQTERTAFAPLVGELLSGMRKRLVTARAKPAVRAALDDYLTVAHSLLLDKPLAPTAGGSAEQVAQAFEKARSAQGDTFELFGKRRETDLTQFKPRGHYEAHKDLIPYFRAMIWLGRMDFRVLQTLPSGAQQFQRDELEAALLARELMGDRAMAMWSAVDQGLAAFIGMHDNATPTDVDALLSTLKARSLRDTERLSDAQLRGALQKVGFGRQRILSDWMGKYAGAPPLPNNSAFALFGQRYTLDGHALHSFVEDRVPDRKLPNALDVGFSVLRNNAALGLMGPAVQESTLGGALASMRTLVDSQKEDYWKSSFYTLWLAALRGMAPEDSAGLPKSARTDAWQRRTLLTQLGSWSELRHDTVLYAKQSYTTYILCNFPDAYVDPYPEVYRRLAQSSDLGLTLARRLESASGQKLDAIRSYFTGAKQTFLMLEQMAQRQLEGKRLTAKQLDWVNHMIVAQPRKGGGGGCGGGDSVTYSGWYRQLFHTADVEDADVSIADVHTAKEGVLHVGKRFPLQAVISIDDGSGPRVFTGAVYSFHQVVSADRLTDSEWEAKDEPNDEPWLAPIPAYARAGDAAEP
jgi:hypothetical protein